MRYENKNTKNKANKNCFCGDWVIISCDIEEPGWIRSKNNLVGRPKTLWVGLIYGQLNLAVIRHFFC